MEKLGFRGFVSLYLLAFPEPSPVSTVTLTPRKGEAAGCSTAQGVWPGELEQLTPGQGLAKSQQGHQGTIQDPCGGQASITWAPHSAFTWPSH